MKLTRKDFFFYAIKAGRWKWRDWRTSLFAVTSLPDNHDLEPYDLDYRNDGIYYYNDSEWFLITDGEPHEPLFQPNDEVTYDEPIVANQSGTLTTTYGRILYNAVVITYAFGSKIPFQQTTLPDKLIKYYGENTVEEPEDGVYKDNKFYPTEIERFVKGCFEITHLCPYVTPTGTIKSLTTHPDIPKVRQQLVEEYKDQLGDPAVVAMIQDRLIELDKEWLSKDNSVGFYISNSAYSAKRRKMFLMHGIEAAFKEDGTYRVIEGSLADGWEKLTPDDIVARFNSTREGSYNRGADTALGGEKVTFLQRVFQNVTVQHGDCGTKITHPLVLTEDNSEHYKGMYIMVAGKPVLLDDDVIKANINKTIHLRRPILCKLPYTDYCSVCATDALSLSPRSAASEISSVGSKIMYAFMSKMHGTELKVSHYDYKLHIN